MQEQNTSSTQARSHLLSLLFVRIFARVSFSLGPRVLFLPFFLLFCFSVSLSDSSCLVLSLFLSLCLGTEKKHNKYSARPHSSVIHTSNCEVKPSTPCTDPINGAQHLAPFDFSKADSSLIHKPQQSRKSCLVLSVNSVTDFGAKLATDYCGVIVGERSHGDGRKDVDALEVTDRDNGVRHD